MSTFVVESEASNELEKMTSQLRYHLLISQTFYYRAFRRFGQAKFAYGGSILGSIKFFNTVPAASKNATQL